MSGEGLLRGPLIQAPLELRLRSGGALTKDRAFCICPKCEAPAFIRRSERITAKVKQLHAHCTNTGCGMTFMMEVSFVHMFNPGLIDRPDLDLAQCPADKIPHVMPPSRDGPDDEDQMTMFAA